MSNLVFRALQKPFLPQQRSHQSLSDGVFSFLGVSGSGLQVTHHNALSLSAVYNAVDQISNDIAKLPKGVFERNGADRDRMPGHAVDYLISKRPNSLMTQFSFHKAMVIAAILRGNGVAEIVRNPQTGKQVAFKFIHPDDIKDIKLKDGQLFYYIKGYSEPLTSEEVIHIPGFSVNGITGISIFKYAAENMATALAAEKFATDNFESKGLLAGLIKTEKAITAVGKKDQMGNAMEARLSRGGTHNIGVLDEGMDFMQIKANAQEAALIDWKKVSIEDVSRWFNMPPHKLKQLDKATYSNIEQQSLEYGSDTIAPWARKFEEEYDYKLFSEKERATVYVKFNTNALIRTDIKTKAEYYSKAINAGWHTRNEIRALEDYNGLDGLDEPLTPANALTQSQIKKNLSNDGE